MSKALFDPKKVVTLAVLATVLLVGAIAVAQIGESEWDPLGLQHDGSVVAGSTVTVTVTNLLSHARTGTVNVKVHVNGRTVYGTASISIPANGQASAVVGFTNAVDEWKVSWPTGFN